MVRRQGKMYSVHFFIYVLVTFFQSHVIFGQDTNVTVMTSSGTLIGFQEDISVDNAVVKLSTFLGIPYAEPPTGQRRFQKPVMKIAMQDPIVAHWYGPECLQLQQQEPHRPSSEDCLHLNIFAPITTADSPLAVMIWIHGGGYTGGTASIYQVDLLAARGNVIVVTFNYRLGPLGFLNLGGGRESNFGLWDQQLAIQWVHNNIGVFGGDKNRVTIFGNSAGAGSVIYQGLYPGNMGLFQRIIAESGTASSPWSETLNYIEEANRFAAKFGCTFDDPDEILSCLKSVPSNVLYNSVSGSFDDFRIPTPFVPSIDGDFIKVSPKHILDPNLSSLSSVRSVFGTFDLLAGTNAAEGAGSVHPLYGVQGDPENFLPSREYFENTLVPTAIRTHVLDDNYGLTHKFLIHSYTNWSSPDDPTKIRLNFVDMHGDVSAIFPCLQTLDVHKMVSSKSTYMYYFNVEPNARLLPTVSWVKTANHGDELRYVFGRFFFFIETNATQEYAEWENELTKTMINMWSNFAKSGNPNLPNAIETNWKPYSATGRDYLEIGKFMNETGTKERLIADKYHLWTSLRPAVYQALGEKCSSETSGTMKPVSISGDRLLAAIVIVLIKNIYM